MHYIVTHIEQALCWWSVCGSRGNHLALRLQMLLHRVFPWSNRNPTSTDDPVDLTFEEESNWVGGLIINE